MADANRKAGDKLGQYKDFLASYDLTAAGAGSHKDTNRFSGKDVRIAYDAGSQFGISDEERRDAMNDYFADLKTQEGVKYGTGTTNKLEKMNAGTLEDEKKPVTPEPVPGPEVPDTPINNPTPPQQEAKERAANHLENMTGDNNNVIQGNNNTIDNSYRHYGGDTKHFNYAGDGSSTDTPVSAATMSGFYDVDDSPAKQARFVDMYSTLNSDLQKKYSDTSSIAQNAINRARANNPINNAALDERIRGREVYSRAKSEQMGTNLFGDMFKYQAPDFQMPEPEKPVETPDFEELYDKYKDF